MYIIATFVIRIIFINICVQYLVYGNIFTLYYSYYFMRSELARNVSNLSGSGAIIISQMISKFHDVDISWDEVVELSKSYVTQSTDEDDFKEGGSKSGYCISACPYTCM